MGSASWLRATVANHADVSGSRQAEGKAARLVLVDLCNALGQHGSLRVLISLLGNRRTTLSVNHRWRDATRNMPLTKNEVERLVDAVVGDYENPHLVANLDHYKKDITTIDISNWSISFDAESSFDAAVCVLAKGCPKLRDVKLDCGSIIMINDTGIIALANGCHELRSFVLAFDRGNEWARDKGFVAFAKAAIHLTYIHLTECNIDTDAIIALGNNCPRLATIIIRCCDEYIEDKAFQALADGCVDLITIKISGGFLSLSTDRAVTSLARCLKLAEIKIADFRNDIGDVDGYTDLTDAGINALANGFPSLTTINLSSRAWLTKGDEITRTAFDAVCKSHPLMQFDHDCQHDWDADWNGNPGYSGLWGGGVRH